MFCKKCGAENLDEKNFCRKCGSPLENEAAPDPVKAEPEVMVEGKKEKKGFSVLFEIISDVITAAIAALCGWLIAAKISIVSAIPLAAALVLSVVLKAVLRRHREKKKMCLIVDCVFAIVMISAAVFILTVFNMDGFVLWGFMVAIAVFVLTGTLIKLVLAAKKLKKILKTVLIILLVLALSAGEVLLFPKYKVLRNESFGEHPRHAPNMYIDCYGDYTYDAVSIDWRCEIDAVDTYWAVHNWDGGYAGFQNRGGEHCVLLSLWDLEDGITPTVEYSKNDNHGDFGGEGTGKQVFTEYDWQVGKWYSMKVEINFSKDGKMIFTQYVAEKDGAWEKCAAISYPAEQMFFDGVYVFQEDFSFSNEKRACSVANMKAKIIEEDEWVAFTEAEISNSYFAEDGATWENGGGKMNVGFDSYWEDGGDRIYIESGGGGFEETCELPATVTIE